MLYPVTLAIFLNLKQVIPYEYLFYLARKVANLKLLEMVGSKVEIKD